MKILLISDDKKILENLNSGLCKNGYDTIIYHWFLKALDNFEEISPDFCVLNVDDYPRHWKILAQFAKSGLLRNQCRIILFSAEKFSDEENKKAENLGIFGRIEVDDGNGIQKLLDLLKKDEKINSVAQNVKNPERPRKSLLARIEAMNNEKQES